MEDLTREKNEFLTINYEKTYQIKRISPIIYLYTEPHLDIDDYFRFIKFCLKNYHIDIFV